MNTEKQKRIAEVIMDLHTAITEIEEFSAEMRQLDLPELTRTIQAINRARDEFTEALRCCAFDSNKEETNSRIRECAAVYVQRAFNLRSPQDTAKSPTLACLPS